jgi:hypothetical protein
VVRIYLPPHSWTARVVMLVNGRVHLPAGRSRSDSWLRPGQQPRGRPRMTASAEAPCESLHKPLPRKRALWRARSAPGCAPPGA